MLSNSSVHSLLAASHWTLMVLQHIMAEHVVKSLLLLEWQGSRGEEGGRARLPISFQGQIQMAQLPLTRSPLLTVPPSSIKAGNQAYKKPLGEHLSL